MPTTSNIGLHVYNDIELSSAFSTVRDWRQSFQGNNASESASDMQIIDAAFGSVFSSIGALSSSIENKQNQLLMFSDVVASNWVADNTYSNYPFKCDISLSGVTASTVVDVIFNLEDATSGDYAPICATLDGIVTIYGKVSAAITIPTIKEV